MCHLDLEHGKHQLMTLNGHHGGPGLPYLERLSERELADCYRALAETDLQTTDYS